MVTVEGRPGGLPHLTELVQWPCPMTPRFTALRKETVMCTVQGCQHVATFVFTGGIDCSRGGHSVVEAYCDLHAEQAAIQLGHTRPLVTRRSPAEAAVREPLRAPAKAMP